VSRHSQRKRSPAPFLAPRCQSLIACSVFTRVLSCAFIEELALQSLPPTVASPRAEDSPCQSRRSCIAGSGSTRFTARRPSCVKAVHKWRPRVQLSASTPACEGVGRPSPFDSSPPQLARGYRVAVAAVLNSTVIARISADVARPQQHTVTCAIAALWLIQNPAVLFVHLDRETGSNPHSHRHSVRPAQAPHDLFRLLPARLAPALTS